MSDTETRGEPQAAGHLCDTDGHAWVWTWPIEGGEGSIGQCSLCGRITTAERDAAARAEAEREEAFVELMPDHVGHNLRHWGRIGTHLSGRTCWCSPTPLPRILAPVEPSGEAESGDDHEHVWRRHQNVTTKGYEMPPYEVCGCGSAHPAWQADGAGGCPECGGSGVVQEAHDGGTHSVHCRCTYAAPVPSGGQADGERGGRERVADEGDLLALPIRSVIAGPAWRSEVYLKAGPDEWYAPAQPDEWTSRTLSHRGPFVVLRLGDEPLAPRPVLSREAMRERMDEHWPGDETWCDCGWVPDVVPDEVGDDWSPVARGIWRDHLADILAGEQR